MVTTIAASVQVLVIIVVFATGRWRRRPAWCFSLIPWLPVLFLWHPNLDPPLRGADVPWQETVWMPLVIPMTVLQGVATVEAILSHAAYPRVIQLSRAVSLIAFGAAISTLTTAQDRLHEVIVFVAYARTGSAVALLLTVAAMASISKFTLRCAGCRHISLVLLYVLTFAAPSLLTINPNWTWASWHSADPWLHIARAAIIVTWIIATR